MGNDKQLPKHEMLLLGLGFSNLQARILSSIIKNGALTVAELEKEAGVTKARVYQIIKDFSSEGIVYGSEDWPKKYRVRDSYIETLKNKLSSLSTEFAAQFLSGQATSNFILEVKTILSNLDFDIREDLDNRPKVVFFEDIVTKFSPFIGQDSDYKYLCLIIDKSTDDLLLKTIDKFGASYIVHQAKTFAERLECLTPLFFIDNSLPKSKEIVAKLKDSFEDESEYTHSRRGYHPNAAILLHTEDIHLELLSELQDIKARQKTVFQLSANLKKKIDSVDDRMLECESLAQTDSFGLLEYGKGLKEKLDLIRKPIEEIIQRERNNKNLVKQKYRQRYVNIIAFLEQIDNRRFLPAPGKVSFFIDQLNAVDDQLTPIIFELKRLRANLVGYLFGEQKHFNPFAITIPADSDTEVINQDKIKKSFAALCKEIESTNGTSMRVLKGIEGMGKTHLLKHALSKSAKKNGLLYLYTSCEIKQEFIQNLSLQIINGLVSKLAIDKKDAFTFSKKGYCDDVDEFMELMYEAQYRAKGKGYHGLVVAIDEFENALENPGAVQFRIKNINKLLSVEIGGLGLVISCRSDKYELLQEHLQIMNLSSLTELVSPLRKDHVIELISNRCKTWNAQKMKIPDEIIDIILDKTESNTRSIIKYCRELYPTSLKHKLKPSDVTQINIPLFWQKGEKKAHVA